MKKKNNRGGLIKLKPTNIIDRQAPEGLFRVIGITDNHQSVWIEGTYSDFKSAKMMVDKKVIKGVQYCIHSDSNRILYSVRG